MQLYSRFIALFADDQNDLASIERHRSLLRPLFFAIIAAAIAIAGVLLIDLKFGLTTGSMLGPFGDFFGGVLNPIFTFLTFFGLIATIVIQRMELRLARDEYAKTAVALNTQAVENTFFNVLDLHHEISAGLTFDPEIYEESEMTAAMRLAGVPRTRKSPVHGRGVFDAILLEIQNRTGSPQKTIEQYRFLQDRHNHVLGHYFRNLYQALKLIDSYSGSLLSKAEKEKYASILRSQLSSSELVLLFLNCLRGMVDDGQFKNLVVRYRMLEHIPLRLVDGVYRATDRNIPLADESILSQYLLEETTPSKPDIKHRGAFGTNPITLADR